MNTIGIGLNERINMIITHNKNGSITVADIINGYRIAKTYYFYSEEEAKEEFLCETQGL